MTGSAARRTSLALGIVLPIGASIGLIWWVVTLVTAWLPVGFDSPPWRVLAVIFLVVVTIVDQVWVAVDRWKRCRSGSSAKSWKPIFSAGCVVSKP